MDMINCIGKEINEIVNASFYNKYFNQIEIQDGIDVYMLYNPLLGVDLILNKNYIVKSIHFYSGDTSEGINRFPDDLPFDLKFELTRPDTRRILGEPQKTGGGDFSFLYGLTRPWDKYHLSGLALHLQFSEKEDKIDLVTIENI